MDQASATRTLVTPAALAASFSGRAAVRPATSTWMSPPSRAAAPSVVSVAPFRLALSCSAMTRMAISDHPGFVLELVDQFRDGADLDAGLALGRLGDLERLQSRRDLDAEIGRAQVFERLLLAFMMLGSEA